MPDTRPLASFLAFLAVSATLALIGYHTNAGLSTIMGHGYADALTVLVLMLACFVMMVILFFVLPDEVGDFLGPVEQGEPGDPNENRKNGKGSE